LETADAHGADDFWPSPMLGYVTQATWKKQFSPHLLGKEYLQANCAQCHTETNFAGAPLVAHGRELFYKTGCYGCHRIEGLSAGTLGPELTEVGKTRKLDYLWAHTVDPRALTPTSFMPKFKLSEEELKALVIFLKSRRGMNYAETALDRFRFKAGTAAKQPGPAVPQEVALKESPAVHGERLVQERACLACHKLGERDGGISPDLSYEGLMRDEAWLMDHFKDPHSREPDSVMPAFPFVEADFRDITTYLGTLNQRPAPMTAAQTYSTLCSRCHGEKGDGYGMSAIYLDPAPRDFTRTSFMISKPETRFLQSIREGVPGTSMPVWGSVLDTVQVQAVFDHVWQSFVREPRTELKPRNVPERNPVVMSADSASRGEHIFLQRCTGCHGRKADGKGPNSLDITPRPRNLRNAAFIQKATDRRLFESVLYGVEGTAMPSWIDYGLSQNDVGDVVNFVRSLK
jgi:sulfur oxidation c-type cytochrome SoxX